MPKISKETPLSEITLRRYENPGDSSGRVIIRKLCLSLGLLQPGDSRDIIVDILYVLIKARNSKKSLSSTEIEQEVIAERKKEKLPLLGIAPSNIRRQLRRLREIFLVEKTANRYSISEFAPVTEIFEEKIAGFYLNSITARIREYCEKADKL